MNIRSNEMGQQNIIKVMIADDHHIVRDGLAMMLATQNDMKVVAEAENGEEAIELYEQHKPDVVLMDLTMPVRDGLEAIVEIRKNHPQARIIVLTTYDRDEDMYRAVQAGAASYLLKASRRNEVLNAIRAVHKGVRHIPPEVEAKLAQRPPLSDLTAREIEILRHIVDGKSNREVADLLSITENTVKFHLKAIHGKLNVSDRTQAVTIAIRRGLLRLE
jgi:two-component system, NarL family, response regulator